MILGYPGRTNRYNNSFAIYEKEKVTNPVSVKLKREKENIIKRWMDIDPKIRLKYADEYFGMSNVQELLQGEVYNFRRYGVVNIKKEQEKELQAWINQNPDRVKKWGQLLDKLGSNTKNRRYS